MSAAIAKTVAVGYADPRVLQAAKVIMQHGWRVTSIYRPSGTHAKGISLDVAPLTFVSGGFGLRTAGVLWRLVKSIDSNQTWLANAELDHVHLQIFPIDALSYNSPNGTIVFPITSFTNNNRLTFQPPRYL